MGGQVRRLFDIASNRVMIAAMGGFALLFLLGAGGLVAWGGYPSIILLSAVCFAVCVPVLIALVIIPISRAYLTDIDRMLAGNAWVHWHYDEAAWATSVATESRAQRGTNLAPALVAAGLGAAVLLFGLAQPDPDQRTMLVMSGSLVVAVGLIVAGCTLMLGRPAFAGRKGTGDIYISPLGIYVQPGGYTPLFGPGFILREIALQEGATPRLRFRGLSKRRDSGFSTTLPVDLCTIAIPPDREAEARDLVARFKAEILPRGAAA